MTSRPASLYVLREDALDAVYGPADRARVATLTAPVAAPQTADSLAERLDLLARVEVLLAGWGAPRLDRTLLAHAPNLRAVFYAGGSVAPIMTPDAWARGVLVTCAAEANAVPVAEYVVSMTLLSLKGVWRLAADMRARRTFPVMAGPMGAYRRCVGLVSLGAVGRAVVRRLTGVDVTIIAYDPYVSRREARRLGVRLVPLPELFARADVIAIQTPHLDDTVDLIGAEHLAAMKPGATLINTSRGPVVDEDALVAAASARPDLQVVLDVTRTMPLPEASPLYSLPNVLLTPHIAGSCGDECRRLGQAMVNELRRYVAGRPMRWQVSPASARHTSHESPVPLPLRPSGDLMVGRRHPAGDLSA